jgi:hypothetical protein
LLPLHAVGAHLSTLDANILVARNALTLDVRCPIDPRLALLTLNALGLLGANLALLAFDALRLIGPRLTLLALDPGRAFDTRLPLDPLRLRRPLDASLAFGTLGTLRSLGALGLRRFLTALAVRLSARRCRDRQRGYTGGEDHPIKHVLSPFERVERSARGAVPTVKRIEHAT